MKLKKNFIVYRLITMNFYKLIEPSVNNEAKRRSVWYHLNPHSFKTRISYNVLYLVKSGKCDLQH